MDYKPRVSIITVCLNSENFIKDTFESVLFQTYENIEYIVIDGGSTDSTTYAIKDYEIKFNGKMKWISEIDNGISEAMNKGIMMSKGDIVCFLHSDDYYYHKRVVGNAVNMFMITGCKWGYGQCIVQDLNNSIDYYYVNPQRNSNFEYEELFKHNFIPHPSTFIKKDIFKKYGYYDTKYKYSMDRELWLRIGCYNKPFISKEIFTVFRVHDRTTTFNANSIKKYNEWLKMTFKHAKKTRQIVYGLIRYLYAISKSLLKIFIPNDVLKRRAQNSIADRKLKWHN